MDVRRKNKDEDEAFISAVCSDAGDWCHHHDHYGRNIVGNDGGDGDPRNTHMESNDKDEVKRHIGNTGDG